MTPKVSIVIPTYTQIEKLAKCLESIRLYTDPSISVIVVANGATVETRIVFAEFARLWDGKADLLWFAEPLGFARACNIGMEAAHSDYVVLFNDDCELLPQERNDWIQRLLKPFDDGKVGITGELMNFCPNAGRNFLLFFCVMIRKAMLDEIGMLDTAFKIGGGEDTDMCCRAEDNGWKVLSVSSESVYADRGDPSLPAHQQQIWVNDFPLWHSAGETVSRIEGFQEVFKANGELLKRRYNVNIERAKSIEGWMADSELEWLARQAKKASCFIEIGSWAGRSTRAITDNLPVDAVLFACDSWCGSSGEPDAHKTAKEREGDGAFMRFYDNLYDHIRLGRVIPIRMDSVNAAETLAKKGVLAETIFIDGDHSLEGVRRDIEAWQPLLKEGGMLCGHDYYLPEQNPLAWIGVRECVDTMFPEAIQAPDTTIWTVKDMSAWERLQQLPVTESFGDYGGFFCTENPNNLLPA